MTEPLPCDCDVCRLRADHGTFVSLIAESQVAFTNSSQPSYRHFAVSLSKELSGKADAVTGLVARSGREFNQKQEKDKNSK